MSERKEMLRAVNVTVAAGSAVLVDNVSIQAATAEVVGLLGANGAGKSTLLKACAGELETRSGSITLAGSDLRSLPASALARLRAVVSQSTELSFPFTAHEVVLLGCTVPGFKILRSPLERAATIALAEVGLSHVAGRRYTHLSGGERQRVQIARALCQLAAAQSFEHRPALLLLDEPTSSLDLAHQRLVLGRLRRFAECGNAVVAVLHDINLAAAYCDRLVIMKSGRVLANGAPMDVIQSKVLTKAYGCPIDANTIPEQSIPFALPVTATASKSILGP